MGALEKMKQTGLLEEQEEKRIRHKLAENLFPSPRKRSGKAPLAATDLLAAAARADRAQPQGKRTPTTLDRPPTPPPAKPAAPTPRPPNDDSQDHSLPF